MLFGKFRRISLYIISWLGLMALLLSVSCVGGAPEGEAPTEGGEEVLMQEGEDTFSGEMIIDPAWGLTRVDLPSPEGTQCLNPYAIKEDQGQYRFKVVRAEKWAIEESIDERHSALTEVTFWVYRFDTAEQVRQYLWAIFDSGDGPPSTNENAIKKYNDWEWELSRAHLDELDKRLKEGVAIPQYSGIGARHREIDCMTERLCSSIYWPGLDCYIHIENSHLWLPYTYNIYEYLWRVRERTKTEVVDSTYLDFTTGVRDDRICMRERRGIYIPREEYVLVIEVACDTVARPWSLCVYEDTEHPCNCSLDLKEVPFRKDIWESISYVVELIPSEEECAAWKTAIITDVKGEFAEVDVHGNGEFTAATKGMILQYNSVVGTGLDSEVTLLYCSEKHKRPIGKVRVKEMSTYRIRSFLVTKHGITPRSNLKVGELDIKVDPRMKHIDFEVSTPTCIAGVRGTHFSISHLEDTTTVMVFGGEVEVTDIEGRKTVYVDEGYSTACSLGGVPSTPVPFAQPPIAFTSKRDGNAEVYVMTADGTRQTNLTNNPADDFQTAWSPDSDKIAFTSSRDGNFEIYTMNADGSNQTNLTNIAALDETAVWSPDGSLIAFRSDHDGNGEIYVMNADGSNPTRLTNNPALERWPTWSPNGNEIAFESNCTGNFEIYVMNADGTNQINLTNNPANDQLAAWSPDGSKIAFASTRDGNWEIYVMNADGTNQLNLSHNSADDRQPKWSPDSSQIVFMSDRAGNQDIYVMNADGSNVRRLTDNPAEDCLPAWSPAGSDLPLLFRD